MLIVYFSGVHCAAACRCITQNQQQRELGQALIASIMVAVVSSATFDALTFPMFSGLLFLIIGCAGAYLGLMKDQAPQGNGLVQQPGAPARVQPGHRMGG